MAKQPTPNSKTRKDRVEFLRSIMDHDGVRQYVKLLDNAKTKRELHEVGQLESQLVPEYSTFTLEVRFCFYDAMHENEDRISREIKQADKDRIAAKKADKLAAIANDSEVLQGYLKYPMLCEAITTIAESFRPDLVNSFRDNKFNRLQRFIVVETGVENDRLEVKEPVWEGRSKHASINHYKLRAYESNLSFIKPYHNNNILKWNYREMIQKEAKDYAQYVLEGFRAKLAWKLGPVIDRKGGGTVSLHGGVYNHTILLSFPDGSKFVVQSQIVNAVSKNGVLFSRHPLTFHDVVFEDGTKMKTPSAEKMQKGFGIDIKNKN